MRLSKRIYAIAEQVNIGETAADIGTDHGYVPMLLMKNGISPAVIMSDISSGSLAKAVQTFEMCGINVPETAFRVGDGLDTIESAEVDDVIIGGLGGFTITEILQSNIDKSRSFRKLILQPRKHSGNLRFFLYTHGWDIVSEKLAPEGKFVCEIITAVPVPGITEREAPYPEEDIRWKYPEAIVNADRELAVKRISWKIDSLAEQIESLSHSSNDSAELSEQLKADRQYLIDLIRD
jgi:tRNA (adenine22-N1)-methyltransferase